MNKIDIKSLSLEELVQEIINIGEKGFRAKQIFEWLHKKRVIKFEDMKNVSVSLREKLGNHFYIDEIKLMDELVSENDQTRKFLFQFQDGQVIETVLMKYKHGNSVCISSQAGCKMGCSFCASTIGGLIRNLSPAEMLEQIYFIERHQEIKISNIVVMGTGEPFDNYGNLLRFIHLINDEKGRNIGQRSITVSTCGIVPGILDFADENLQVNLAISLHATSHETRKKTMPIENKYEITELLDACKYYLRKTNRRITFEYALINDVNDTKEEAIKLARLLNGMLCHVNLIPVNPVEGRSFKRSFAKNVELFKNTLIENKINATVRRALGSDINAACGQLRRKYVEKNM